MLVVVDGFERGDYGGAAWGSSLRSSFARRTAKGSYVVDARGDAGDAFVIERPPLPAVGDGVGERADFVGMQASKVFTLAEQDAHVRTEEFVGGADQEVAVEGGDVDEAVRAVVDGINVH